MTLKSSIYRTNDNEIDIEKIQNVKDEKFIPLSETGIAFAGTDEVYWVKTIIQNKDSITREFMIHVNNPRINKLQFFTYKDGIAKKSILTGDNFPFHQRSIKNRNFLHPITLVPNESIDLYIYANKRGESIHLFLKLWDKSIFYTQDHEEVTLWGLFIGFCFCICLLVISITLFIYKKLFFYFSIYCFAITLNFTSYIGLGYQYLWSNSPYFNDICGYTFVVTYSIALIAMTRNYLRMDTFLPRLNTILKSYQFILLILWSFLLFYKNMFGIKRSKN